MRFLICSKRFLSGSGNGKTLKIGNIRVPIRKPSTPQLVPYGYSNFNTTQISLSHLKWLLQKDILKQDVFLLGVPGSLRSGIVLQYLELCGREYEYLAVTRDTTEADIKQRREIKGGNAFYTDLCAVRAALNGRVLVIDGVEKAERNVLPILNNLLENREMQLDDGRFLMHSEKYDKLLEKYTKDNLKQMGVERVAEDFRVVAMGLPVPRFPGHTLDPPLRSRFQCRHVPDLPFQNVLDSCHAIASSVKSSNVNDIVSLAYAINSQEELQLPRVPVHLLDHSMKIWNSNPKMRSESVFRTLYPIESLLRDNQATVVNEFVEKFGVKDSAKNEPVALLTDISKQNSTANVSFEYEGSNFQIQTNVVGRPSTSNADDHFVKTQVNETLLTELTLAHSQGDFALLGAKGTGKTTLLTELAKRLEFDTETMILYQDMNTRELLQRRRMEPNGDTVWEDSQLVSAAKQGTVCILDGAERVHWSALESLSLLCHHRLLHLPDGTRLVGEKEYQEIMINTGKSEEELTQSGVHRIPLSFRLVLVGDSECSEHRWLNEAVISLMPFITMRSYSEEEQIHIIDSLAPSGSKQTSRKLVRFVNMLKNSHDAGLRGVALSLSLRKMIQIARRDALHGGDLRDLIEKSALAKFLPSITRTAFNNVLNKEGFESSTVDKSDILEDLKVLRNESLKQGEEAMIPDVLFYDNDDHVSVMRDMARDLRLGCHLLLIGNQGVGKNKITDRFLHLINRPRQYMQLHRDTTVESLTMQTTVEGGILRHEDSALVRAARAGHILVVDEADKAPLHVIAILKSLIDSGTLLLGDGRRIESSPRSQRSIPLHPNFRIIMLANRPGFPFLGNDLFGVLGDLFSVHTVHNANRENEIEMLRKYAPDVPLENVSKLVAAFTELRDLADDGLLQYPYSTRELVNIVKHANQFPADSFVEVVKNVFDFDEYSEDSRKTIEDVFQKHGIPLGIDRTRQRVMLSHRHKIDPMIPIGHMGIKNDIIPTQINSHRESIRTTSSIPLKGQMLELRKEHMRNDQFTEQECSWQIPMLDINICSDGLFHYGNLLVATVNPLRLYIINDLENTNQVEEIDLSSLFGANRRIRNNFQPRLRLAKFGPSGVLMHEEITNSLFLIDLQKRTVDTVDLQSSFFKNLTEMFIEGSEWRMVDGQNVIMFERKGKGVILLNEEGQKTIIQLMHNIHNIIPVNANKWIIKYENGSMDMLFLDSDRFVLRSIDSNLNSGIDIDTLRVDGQSTYFQSEGYYCLKSDGFPLLFSMSEIIGAKRPEVKEYLDPRRPYYLSDVKTKSVLDMNRNMIMLEGGIIVSSQPKWSIPKEVVSNQLNPHRVSGFLEAINPKQGFVQYIPVQEPKFQSYHGAWLASIAKPSFIMVPWSATRMITIDTNGGIRSFELSPSTLGKSFNAWNKLFGGEDGPLRLEVMKDESSFDITKLDTPKIGQFDPNNAPHHGGNTWMGGTGGYNTAGMGGVGGPFRLDAGHDVHQMPEMVKQQVPDHILQKAREIAKVEYQKKLKEINMSEHDADMYDTLWKKIEKQSNHLKSIIEQLESKKKERQWTKHQTSGDLDDGKLIEGVTGEKNIYRRRVDKLPERGTPQVLPKRLRICVDVSGSMYRFNGYDKRLQKTMEAMLMVMNSLDGQYDKVHYDIIGHSGDTPCTNFIVDGHYPKDNKERLNILKQMLAHTQFCASGDFTVEALEVATTDLAKEEDCDERIVVLISDANLDRYGIKPKHLINVMNKETTVNSYIILIGSLGEQAERLQRALPAGKAFVCKETSELPQIMQNIFASTLI